jgi:hypothetical protein
MNLVGYLLVGTVAVYAVVDSALAVLGEGKTISYQLSKYSMQWPVIPFVLGFLMGHLFFPNHAFCP